MGELSKKIALRGIKDKIQGQAENLCEEERMLKEKCDIVRRQEEQLKNLRNQVQKWESETSSDRRNAILVNLKVEFDKYLRLYSRESEKLKRQRDKNNNQ